MSARGPRASAAERVAAVRQQDRRSVPARAAGMNEVDALAVQFGGEVAEAVEPCFFLPPVKAGSPMLNELAEERDAGAIVPAGVLHFVGIARGGEASLEVVDVDLWNINRERVHLEVSLFLPPTLM